MRKQYGTFFCGAAIMLSFAGAAPCARAAEDAEEKMKIMREMFKSPYTEESYYRTDRLLVTATGSQLPIHKAPSVANIITKEDIEEMGATTLDEVLETVPGLHVSARPGGRLDGLWSIRGIHTKLNPQVLFMVNGVPVQYAYYGTRPGNFRMPVADISRIEIVRGPGSALHGADAYAGVVNVFTKDGFEITGPRAGVRAGSFDTYETWLQHGGDYNGWNLAMGVEYQTTGGDPDRIVHSDLQKTSFDRPPFRTRVSLTPGELNTDSELINSNIHIAKGNWTARAWGWFLQDAGLGAGTAQALDPRGWDEERQLLADLTYQNKKLVADWDFSARASYYHLTYDSFSVLFPPGARLPIRADGNVGTPVAMIKTFPQGLFGSPNLTDNQGGLDLSATFSGLVMHKFRLGAGTKYTDEDTRQFTNYGPGALATGIGNYVEVTDPGKTFMSNQTRLLWYALAQDEWHLARSWDLTFGVRYDHYSDFGETVNPRAALVWETRHDFTTKLLYGEAFRAPSFIELYAQNNPAILGNSALQPETNRTLELVFDYQPSSSFHPILSLFGYKASDLIQNVPGAVGNVARNALDQNGYGFELEVEWLAREGLRLRGDLSYQRSKDAETEALVADAPTWQFHLNPHWEMAPQWSLDAHYYRISGRHRAAGDTRPEIGDYDWVGLTVRKKEIVEHLDLAMGVRNLFDEDVREPSDGKIQEDYPMPGRSLFGELRYTF